MAKAKSSKGGSASNKKSKAAAAGKVPRRRASTTKKPTSEGSGGSAPKARSLAMQSVAGNPSPPPIGIDPGAIGTVPINPIVVQGGDTTTLADVVTELGKVNAALRAQNIEDPSQTLFRLSETQIAYTRELFSSTGQLGHHTQVISDQVGTVQAQLEGLNSSNSDIRGLAGNQLTTLNSVNSGISNLHDKLGVLAVINSGIATQNQSMEGFTAELKLHAPRLDRIADGIASETTAINALGIQLVTLSNINEGIAAQNQGIAGVSTELKGHVPRLEKIADNVVLGNTAIAGLGGQLATLNTINTGIVAQNAALGDVGAELKAHAPKLDQIAERITLGNTAITGLSGQLATLSTINTGIVTQNEALSGVSAELKAHAPKLDQIAERITLGNNAITGLGGQLATLNTINTGIVAQNSALGDVSAELKAHAPKLDQIAERITLGNNAITGLGAQLATLSTINTGIVAQNSALGDVSAELKAHAPKFDKIAETINVTNTTLNGLGTQLATLGTISTGILTQNEGVAGLNTELRSHGVLLEAIRDNISGQVPSQGSQTLSLNVSGPEVAKLHELLAKLDSALPKTEIDSKFFGPGTLAVLQEFQARHHLPTSGLLDPNTRMKLESVVAGSIGRSVQGRLVSDQGHVAGSTKLRLYRVGFGSTRELLGEGTSDDKGFYSIGYNSHGKPAHLEMYALDESGTERPLSFTKYNADKQLVLNLVVPTVLSAAESEYVRLTRDLSSEVGNLANLSETKEAADRQDLTRLYKSTGWDARLIGNAALAQKRSAATGLAPEILYALARVGLPTETDELAAMDAKLIESALVKAKEAGIIRLDDATKATALAKFSELARATWLGHKSPGSVSSFGEMLDRANISIEDRRAFETALFNQGGEGAGLWEEAIQQKVSGGGIQKLQLQGKLAFLTFNNSPLVQSLQTGLSGAGELSNLVDQGLDKAASWITKIETLASGSQEKLKALIPPIYFKENETLDTALKNYATELARKVATSFPIRVISKMVSSDELTLGSASEHARRKTPTALLLNNAEKLGFRLGESSLETLFREKSAQLMQGIDITKQKDALEGANLVNRLYQITPSDQALKTLMGAGFTSSHQITEILEEDFLQLHGLEFDSDPDRSVDIAKLVYARAAQVRSVIQYCFTSMETVANATSPAATAATPAARAASSTALIKRFPTLEALFGSLDYCECEHCRSVLSPAAYLVDLLQFIDPRDTAWDAFGKLWKKRYQKDYPHQDPATGKFLKPYDVFLKRRPDLPELPLTCENTNVALPYIDLVNEILEYHVVHSKLEEAAAHDTGNAKTAELLAEPQNILPAAYDTLAKARYPLALPFDLWLETGRSFLSHFDVTLAQVMETFRTSSELFDALAPYDRAAVFSEQLGFSPAEYRLFTDPDPLATWFEWYGFKDEEAALTPATTPDGQRADLQSAKRLSRRLGVTYKELTELIQTRFVNPEIVGIDMISRLNLGLDTLIAYFAQSNAATKIEPLNSTVRQLFSLRAAELGILAKDLEDKVKSRWDGLKKDKLLVLVDPSSGCDFDKTILQYSDAHAVDGIALLRLNVFVRLWRKLGWSIADVDTSLEVFIPKSAPFEATNLKKRPLESALVYLAHFKELEGRLGLRPDQRSSLLTLWSDLTTSGKDSLYARTFLKPGVLKLDPVFDDALGDYLVPSRLASAAERRTFRAELRVVPPDKPLADSAFDGERRVSVMYDSVTEVQSFSCFGPISASDRTRLQALSASPVLKKLLDLIQEQNEQYALIAGHLPAIQGAIGLSSEDIGLILEHQGVPLEIAELSIANLSVLYRYAFLGKALKLGIPQLLSLQDLTGLNPFQSLLGTPIRQVSEDYPLTQTIQFLERVELVKLGGVETADLNYLLRHAFDVNGKYRNVQPDSLAFLRNLAEGIRSIRLENPIPKTYQDLDEELLKQKLATVLPNEIVDTLVGLLNGTAEFTSTIVLKDGIGQLRDAEFAKEPAILEIAYNPIKQEQRMTVRAVSAERRRLEERHPSEVLGKLLQQIDIQVREFFDKWLKKQSVGSDKSRGFLEEAHFAKLFSPLEPLQEILPADTDVVREDKQKKNEVTALRNRSRFLTLAQTFLPALHELLISQLISQKVADVTGIEPSLAYGLLAYGDASKRQPPILDDLVGSEQRGITTGFFAASPVTSSDTPIKAAVLLDADLTLRGPDALLIKPVGTNSARLEGYLEVTTPGAYRFEVELGMAGAEVEIHFDHLPGGLFWKATSGGESPETHSGGHIELDRAVLYKFKIVFNNLKGGSARLLVQGESLPRGELSRVLLYPLDAIETARASWIRLVKTIQLFQSLGLREREVKYVLSHSAEFGGFNVSLLPASPTDDRARLANAKKLFNQVARLAEYVQLRKDMVGESDDLVEVLEAKNENDTYRLIAELTRRDQLIVGQIARALVLKPPFTNDRPLAKIWEALKIVSRLDVPVSSIMNWPRLASLSAFTTSSERFELARNIKEGIKGKYREAEWLRVAQPIFDRLRAKQRDALVSYIMHYKQFDRIEQLFEYFLIDPGMEPVVQTSRLRLAISSVQLFIQRCFLNLEAQVHPSALNSKHWQWMKRYRVWEANRKIFLFPENWLEPEFRDDKSDLFQELEGALLQGDVSNDLVEDALFTYLKKLEHIARLEIVATYCSENAEAGQNVLHVIGRTSASPHKYFYRQNAQTIWSPWEAVSAEIESDHILAVVWRERLHLFWLTFQEKAEPSTETDLNSDSSVGDVATSALQPPNKFVEVVLNWSEYYQGSWTTREGAGFADSRPVSPTLDMPSSVVSLKPLTLRTRPTFTSSQVSVHVSKVYDGAGESEIRIHLHIPKALLLAGGPRAGLDDDKFLASLVEARPWDTVYRRSGTEPARSLISLAFSLSSKNSPPRVVLGDPLPASPYPDYVYSVNRLEKRGRFSVRFSNHIESTDNGSTTTRSVARDIFQKETDHSLVLCGVPLSIPNEEIGQLISPVFYQDAREAFFVRPSLTEKTIDSWEKWVVSTPVIVKKPDWSRFEKILIDRSIIPAFPDLLTPLVLPSINNGVTDPIDIDARHGLLNVSVDPLRHPSNTLDFENHPIGRTGGLGFDERPQRVPMDGFPL